MRVRVVKIRDLQPATAAGAIVHEEADLTRPIHAPIVGELRGLVQKGRRWATEPVDSIEAALLRKPARLIVADRLCTTQIVSAVKESEFTSRRVCWKVSTVNSVYRVESVSAPAP
jgi:hypothetical protein